MQREKILIVEDERDILEVMTYNIFNWTARPQKEFHALAAAGIIVLLAVLLLMNAAAVIIRHRSQKDRL